MFSAVYKHGRRVHVNSQMWTRPVLRFTATHKPFSDLILQRQKPLLVRLGHYVRILRIPVIAAGIYSVGYHQGVIESHQNPLKFQEQLVESVLEDFGRDKEPVDFEIISEKELEGNSRMIRENRYFQVASVAKQLIDLSRAHIEHELVKAKAQALEKLIESKPEKPTSDEIEKCYEKDLNVKRWVDAQSRFHSSDMDPWQFVFVDTEIVNAFVTEILPRRIFITKGLLEFSKNIDEVAFVLGHEVAHYILGHITRRNDLELNLKCTEIVLLSLDPTAGMLAFIVIWMLDLFRRSIEMSFSREHEREADELGLQLISQSQTFEPTAGSRFMHRLHGLEGASMIPWLETHPSSLERARKLYEEAQKFRRSG